MDKVSKRKVHTVSVTIQWYEEEAITDGENCKPGHNTAAGKSRDSSSPHSILKTDAKLPSKRLLPSDRIVLNALRQRVAKGKQVTTRVRTRDLEVECEISRRQVQICVKRLIEKGFIKRLIENTDWGGAEGYRYHLSKEVLSR